MSQGIYLILQGVVSIKYKDKEIDKRGPNQHVGDECISGLSSIYSYQCSTNVICLFVSYEFIEGFVNKRSTSFGPLRKFVSKCKKNLKQKALASFQSEANLFSQGKLIGEFIEELNKANEEEKMHGMKKRKDTTKITNVEIEQQDEKKDFQLNSKDSNSKFVSISEKAKVISPNIGPRGKEGFLGLNRLEWSFKITRAPNSYKKSQVQEDTPEPEVESVSDEPSNVSDYSEIEDSEVRKLNSGSGRG